MKHQKDQRYHTGYQNDLESVFFTEDLFSAKREELEIEARLAFLEAESPFLDTFAPDARTYDEGGEEQDQFSRDGADSLEADLEEHEFQLNRLPLQTQQYFNQGATSWREAVTAAIRSGIRNAYLLTDLVFFMHHPERMSEGMGRLISKTEPDFFKLRDEWNRHLRLVNQLLSSGATSTTSTNAACTVFLPANPSNNYEDYVAAPTTGRMTLLINGRNNSDGPGPARDKTEAFDAMQRAVEALQAKDTIYLAAWQFDPRVPLTWENPHDVQTWGKLLQRKAKEGVKIRILMTEFPGVATDLLTRLHNEFLPALNKFIGELAPSVRDNLKYIVSQHPARELFVPVGTYHQKFMVVKNKSSTFAFCGGLDISYMRTPYYWRTSGYQYLWHDLHSRLDGLIVHDLEREFILRWNREQASSVTPPLPGWKPFETLAPTGPSAVDRKVDNNSQKLQMLRTVSVDAPGRVIQTTRRDDIWQNYLQLIGCATRFLYMENQYFREPNLADAIVKQVKAEGGLFVMIVVPYQLDDPNNAVTMHGNWLQHRFFTRLRNGVRAERLRIYTMSHRIIHSKFIMVDDRALSIGSANTNPRSFFLDTELNVTLDSPETVRSFRHRLWSHNLGVPETTVATWTAPDFFSKWDAVAKSNERLKSTPDRMTGEGILPEPVIEKGQWQLLIRDVVT